MNKLRGTIIKIESSTEISQVDINVDGDTFNAIVLETPHSAAYLKIGTTIDVIFKETEVSLAKNLSGQISLRNRFFARVTIVESFSILTTVTLKYKSFAVVSIISTVSAQRLNIKPGDDVEWLVKTNEMSLCPLN